jgi:hypothetical protein
LALSVFSLAIAQCNPEPDVADPNATKAPPQKAASPAPPPSHSVARPSAPAACNGAQDPMIDGVFEDNFDRKELGPDWFSTAPAGAYTIRDSRLCTNQPKNHPLWLKKKLPVNVSIRFHATALSPQGDIKAEFFGSGCSFDSAGGEYSSTGYVGVLGAHNNTEHWLARLAEHGPDTKIKADLLEQGLISESKVVANHDYQFELRRRDGKTIEYIVDGVTIHELEDSAPLSGKDHDHFAFDGWVPPVCFDNLVIQKLP